MLVINGVLYSPSKWPKIYGQTGVSSPDGPRGELTLIITGRGPPCTPWKINSSNLNMMSLVQMIFRISILGDF